jgi:hypothetical protein
MRSSILIGISGVVFAALVLAASAPARADLVPIGPFSGQLSESWETFPLPHGEADYLASPTAIMNGAAAIANPYMRIYKPGVSEFSLASSGYAQTADGEQGMGVGPTAQTTTITFVNPITSFGAYWGAHTGVEYGGAANISLNFFDETGNSIGSEGFTFIRPLHDGVLEWHGWFSSVPIGSLTYTEDGVAVDSLQANPTPEPCTTLLLLGGAAALLLRRWS